MDKSVNASSICDTKYLSRRIYEPSHSKLIIKLNSERLLAEKRPS